MTQRLDGAHPAETRSTGRLAVQLILDLSYRPAIGRDSFLVTRANQAAVTWIDAWPHWPASALVLTGPPCCGKTHLASVWLARTGAEAIEGCSLDLRRVPELLSETTAILIETADRSPEEPLLHLLNGMAEQKKHVLLTAHTPPSRWQTKLGDLSSRLRALPVAIIDAPDDMLLQAILTKRFADRGVPVGAEIAAYVASRAERSFSAIEYWVMAIDEAALTAKRAVTLPLVREIMQRLQPDESSKMLQDRH